MTDYPHDASWKQCSKCPNSYPATPEFFDRDRSKPDGLHPHCKTCRKAHRTLHKVEISEYHQQYYQEHKDEHTAYQKQAYQTHREEWIERSKQNYSLHKEERSEQRKQRRKTDKARVGIADRAHKQKRKAQKAAVSGTLTAVQIQYKLKAQKYRCYYAACGYAKFEKEGGKYIFHLEHTIPVSRSEANPRHDADYVVLACPACNMAKHTKLLSEWPAGGRLF